MRRYFRIVGRYNTYSSYDGAKKQLKTPSEWVEVYCSDHGWGSAISDGSCLACHREYWDLIPSEEET